MTTVSPPSPGGSAAALLTGAVDYAGLFPPAALPMPEAAAEYARALGSAEAWLLGRFVVPAGRLPELARARASLSASAGPWMVSALVGDRSDTDLAAIAAMNAAPAPRALAVDAVECKPGALEGIDWLADHCGAGIEVYVEVNAADPAPWIERIAARGLRAKVRTGGVTAAAFPSPAAVVSFLVAAVRARVPFKATAGLHHAVRGSYRLTYEDGAASAPMYGYLNVFLATAALGGGLGAVVAEQILTNTDASALSFSDDAVRWNNIAFPTTLLAATRSEHLVGFGSCSFREPADELRPFITIRA